MLPLTRVSDPHAFLPDPDPGFEQFSILPIISVSLRQKSKKRTLDLDQNADPDPDPGAQENADPDPDPGAQENADPDQEAPKMRIQCGSGSEILSLITDW